MRKHVVIFGKIVPIVRTKNLMQDRDALGLFHRDKFFIEVDASLKDKDLMLTVIHECFHALVQRAGVYQSGLTHEVEEILAEQLSIMIVENFKIK
jgi:Zn-dependent peptidase ImmA (M78 family)